jgi:hypothetical protein
VRPPEYAPARAAVVQPPPAPAAPLAWMPAAEPPRAESQREEPTPVAAKPAAPPAEPELTLLRAVDLMPEPPSRPALSTLASLAAHVAKAPPMPVQTGAGAAFAFPLIDALDIPGSGIAGRGAAAAPTPVAAAPMPHPAPEPAVASAPAVTEPAPKAPRPAVVLAAAEVAVPLAELFRLLAAGPAAPDEAFAALHMPARPADA